MLEHVYGQLVANYMSVAFENSVRAVAPKMLKATLDVYFEMKESASAKSSPDRSIYNVCNLRDISRVIHGVCRASPQSAQTPLHFLRLWGHEMRRVFEDRLVVSEHRLTFRKIFQNRVTATFEDELMVISALSQVPPC
jgi:dynein heavy chain